MNVVALSRDRAALAALLPAPTSLRLVSEAEGRRRLAATHSDDLMAANVALRDELLGLRIGKGGSRSAHQEPGVRRSIFKIIDTDPGTNTGDLRHNEMLVEAIMASQLEVAYYEQDAFHDYQVAPCKLVWHESGLPVVVMEYVDNRRSTFDAPHPEWAEHIDHHQIGWSRRLECWAAYDAGLPPRDSDIYRLGFEAALRADYARLVGEPPANLAACLPELD